MTYRTILMAGPAATPALNGRSIARYGAVEPSDHVADVLTLAGAPAAFGPC
jgi:hypothetical protein